MIRGTRRIEATLVDANHVLVALTEPRPDFDFFGSVVTLEQLAGGSSLAGKTVYLTGDVSKRHELELKDAARVFVIEELSSNYGKDVTRTALRSSSSTGSSYAWNRRPKRACWIAYTISESDLRPPEA